jgi:hypothetical protein
LEIRENEAKAAFLDDPRAADAMARLFDLQYAQYLRANTEDARNNGRLMLAVTTHIYFLYKYAPEMINTKLE